MTLAAPHEPWHGIRMGPGFRCPKCKQNVVLCYTMLTKRHYECMVCSHEWEEPRTVDRIPPAR